MGSTCGGKTCVRYYQLATRFNSFLLKPMTPTHVWLPRSDDFSRSPVKKRTLVNRRSTTT